MHHGCTNVVDKLFLNQLLAIINAVENLSDRQWSCRVLADNTETFLEFGGRRVFQPKEMRWFKLLAHASRFNPRQPMVRIMQKMQFRPKLLAQARKKLPSQIQVH